jgi:thiamine biosynthesis lipoprotein
MTVTLKYSQSLPVMGTTATVTVLSSSPEQHVEQGASLLRQLHVLWSRFDMQSDISRINVASGHQVHVSQHTTYLLKYMKEAFRLTDGWFNPTLLPMQHQYGDDTSLHGSERSRIATDARIYEDLEDIQVTDEHTVCIPADMSLDAGGIGKGLASDLVTDMLLEQGATSVSVNVGGDIRVGCNAAFEHDWDIEILNAHKQKISVISLRNGAVATSSSIARRQGSSQIDTHILQLSQHQDQTVRSASVIASTAAWAEVWTKYVMLAPKPFKKIDQYGIAALLAVNDHAVTTSAQWKEFEL